MSTRVLFVDDDPAVLQLFRMVLEMEQWAVTTATSAAEAVRALAADAFDLVITDMRMESPSAGFDVVRAAAARSPRPAIAILTAFPMAAAEWRPSGADALIVKGHNLQNLTQTLHALLRKRPQADAAASSRRTAP